MSLQNVLFYSLFAALSLVALASVHGEAFAQPPAPQDAVSQMFNRAMSESLSIASTFASPGAPAHHVRTMTESISVQSAFPAPAQQAGPGQPLRSAQYSPGVNQRMDEKSPLNLKNLKRGEIDPQGGTQYVRVERLATPSDLQGDFDTEGMGDSAEPDDSSVYVISYLRAQKSMDGVALMGAATYGSLLVVALGTAGARFARRRAIAIACGPAHARALAAVLAVFAAASLASAFDPSMGLAYADSPAGMAYRIGTSGGVGYREWDPATTSWSSEASLTTAGSQIETVKFLYSPTLGSELRIIGVRETNGEIDIYYCTSGCTSAGNWNGPNLVADMGTPTGGRKYFDMAFESSSGDVLIVYDKTTIVDTSDFFYQVFDADTLTLSGESGFDYISDTTDDNDIRFFQVASKPGSDEIAVALLDATNSDAVALIWDGSSFGNTLTATDTVLSASLTGESFDVAYESASGAALVVAPGLAASETRHARYTGSWSAVSSLAGGINPDVATDDQLWMTLKADPNPSSNKVMACSTDDVSDFSCVQFDAGSPGTATRHDAATGGSARRGDFAWNGWDSTGLVLWYDSSSTEYQYRTWDGGSSTWGTESAAAASQTIIWVTAASDNDSTAGGVDSLWTFYSQASPDSVGDGEYDATTFTLNGLGTISASAGTANTDDVVSLDSRMPRSHSGSPSATVSLSDSITAKIRGRGVPDSLPLSDSVSRLYNNVEGTSDTLGLSDSIGTGLFSPGNAYFFESLSVSDSITPTTYRALSDAMAVSDSPAKAATKPVSDALALSDDAGTTAAMTVAESITISDSPAKAVSKAVSDSVTLSDEIPANTNPAGMAYRSSTGTGTSYPKYREWNPDTSAWGSEVEVGNAGSPVRFAWIEFSPVSSKRVIVTLSDDGYLDSFVCDDSCTSASSWDVQNDIAQVRTTLSGVERPFDMEYEQTNGDLMIVYDKVSTDSAQDLFYRVMPDSSNTFGSESSIDDSTASDTDTAYSFIRMDSRRTSGSDAIGMIAIDSTNSDAIAFVWSGSAWGNEHELTGTISETGMESADVAYESSSGTLIVAAGEGTDIRHNRFTTSWQTSSTSTGTWGVGNIEWVRLVPNPSPSSNEIFLAAAGSLNDLDSAYWDGSSWTDHAEHDDSIADAAGRRFDFAWAGDSSTGVMIWRSTTGLLDYKTFSAPDTFSALGTFVETVNHNWIQLATNPETGDHVAALGATVDTNNDIGGIRWNGGESAPESTGDDAITVGSLDTYEAVQVDFQKATRISKSATETLTVSDSLAPLQDLDRFISDTLGVGDDPRAHVPTPLDETVTIQDSIAKSVSKSVSDSVSVSTAITVQGGGQNSASASDSVPVSVAVSRMYHASRSVAETLALGESAAPTAPRAAAEALSVTDSAEIASGAASSTAAAAYRSNTGTNLLQSPKYREWDPDAQSWSDEVELPTTGSDVRDARLLFSPISTLRVVATVSADGSLNLFACDVSCTDAGSWTHVGGASFANVGSLGTGVPYRPFDMAFEQASGTLVMVYDKGLTEAADFYYRTFDGATLSSENSFDYIGSSADEEEIRYFRAASKAGSDEITMILLDATNSDSYAFVWSGSSFGNQLTVSTSLSTPNEAGESIGAAYETSSGASVVFSGNGADSSAYARWSGSSWSSVQTADPSTLTSPSGVRFARLASDPAAGSDKVMVCETDQHSDLICAEMDAGVLGSWVVHDVDVTTVAQRTFDFAWNPVGSSGVLVWGTLSASKSYSLYDGEWGAEQTVSSTGTNRWIVGATSLSAGDVANSLFLVLNSALDIGTSKFKFGALTVAGESTHTTEASVNTFEGMSIDFQRSTAIRLALSEAVAVSDSAATHVTRAVSDSVPVSDALAANPSMGASDTLGISDSVSVIIVGGADDSLSIIDAVAMGVTRSVTDSLPVSDAVSAVPGRAVSDDVQVYDEVAVGPERAISDQLGVSEQITVSGGKSASDQLDVGDSISMHVTRSLADPVAISDSASRIVDIGISETLAVMETVSKVALVGISDSLAVDDSIYEPPDFRLTLQVSDSVSTAVTRALAESIAVQDALQGVRNVPRGIVESLTIDDGFDEVSVQWNRSFEEEMGIGDCTPFACNPSLRFDESLSLADDFLPPPELADSLSVTDSVSAAQSTSVQLEDTLAAQDAAGFMVELAAPDTPDGVPPLGAVFSTDPGDVEPMAAESISGTYSMDGWDPDSLSDLLGLPAIDVSSLAGTGLTLVLASYHLTLEPSTDVPTDDFMMTVKILEVPADMPLQFPIDMASTAGAEEHAQVPWMTMGYTPAVESEDFALVIAPLQDPPLAAEEADGVASLYLNIDWVGTFPSGLDPGDESFYSEPPEFTFAVTEEWADENNAERDENGVPVIELNLLDESTGEWAAITDVDAPLAANDDGQYVYVAHLEHFSSYAIAADEAVGGGGGRSVRHFSAGLAESLALLESFSGRQVTVIEEFVGERFAANLLDYVTVSSRPVAYKTLEVGEDVRVLVNVQQVSQGALLPPAARAIIEVTAINAGVGSESFALEFWYNDSHGNRSFESGQAVALGPYESRRFAIDVPFASPGTYDVIVEARSIPEGDILGTTQLGVDVPWLAVYLYLLLVAAAAILGGTAVSMLMYMKRREPALALAASGAAVLARPLDVFVVEGHVEAAVAGPGLHVGINVENAEAGTLRGTHVAAVEFDMLNRSEGRQEFDLICEAREESGVLVQRAIQHIGLAAGQPESRVVEIDLRRPGRYVLYVDVRSMQDRVLAKGRTEVATY